MRGPDFIIILSTAASAEEATKIAEQLVADRVVACVNILPGMQSVYWWKDSIQKESEVLMIMKTTKEKFSEVQRTIQSAHSYEVPEVISFSIEQGSEDYLKWLESSLLS